MQEATFPLPPTPLNPVHFTLPSIGQHLVPTMRRPGGSILTSHFGDVWLLAHSYMACLGVKLVSSCWRGWWAPSARLPRKRSAHQKHTADKKAMPTGAGSKPGDHRQGALISRIPILGHRKCPWSRLCCYDSLDGREVCICVRRFVHVITAVKRSQMCRSHKALNEAAPCQHGCLCGHCPFWQRCCHSWRTPRARCTCSPCLDSQSHLQCQSLKWALERLVKTALGSSVFHEGHSSPKGRKNQGSHGVR